MPTENSIYKYSNLDTVENIETTVLHLELPFNGQACFKTIIITHYLTKTFCCFKLHDHM